MSHFPFFVDIRDMPVLVVGGGRTAAQKVEKLLPFGPRITVVAPQIAAQLKGSAQIEHLERPFKEEDLTPPPAFVIAATNNGAVNRELAALCRARGIPINVVDDPALCSFYFPALVQRGELTVAISTSGCSPTAAACVREEIDAVLPAALGVLLPWIRGLRRQLKARMPEAGARAAALRALWLQARRLERPLTAEEAAQLVPALRGLDDG